MKIEVWKQGTHRRWVVIDDVSAYFIRLNGLYMEYKGQHVDSFAKDVHFERTMTEEELFAEMI